MRKQKGLPCLTQYQRVCLPWSGFKLLATKKIQNQANCGLLVSCSQRSQTPLEPFQARLHYRFIRPQNLKARFNKSMCWSNLKTCFFIALHSVVEHWETRCFNLWIWNNPSHIVSTARRSKKRRPLQARCIAVRSARLAHTHFSFTSLNNTWVSKYVPVDPILLAACALCFLLCLEERGVRESKGEGKLRTCVFLSWMYSAS